eukprot:6243653-Amphidinium_carterae.1
MGKILGKTETKGGNFHKTKHHASFGMIFEQVLVGFDNMPHLDQRNGEDVFDPSDRMLPAALIIPHVNIRLGNR